MTLDTQLLFFLNNLTGQSVFFDKTILFFAELLPYLVVGSFLLLIFFSTVSLKEKVYLLGVTAFSAFFARGIFTELIRYFYNRPRPYAVLEINNLFTNNGWSFPSGHTTFFFALAVTIYLYNKKWGIGFILAALLMAIARIIAGVHYPTDILGGILIGGLTAMAVTLFSKKLKP